jgi:ribokinase
MRILNFGSLNIDHVYQVDHIVRPGETLSSGSYQVFAGGKGANQSAALALAGASVCHAGQVGPEGQWLLDKLAALGVDMRFTLRGRVPTGHAVIQVDPAGQNAIFLYPGANVQIVSEQIDSTLSVFGSGDILLLQNEISNIPYLINKAHSRGMKICLNPAPFGPEVLAYPLEQVDLLVLNETEAQGLVGRAAPDELLDAVGARFPGAEVIITLGARGALYCSPVARLQVPAVEVTAVDTTAAGDTFIGYYLASAAAGREPERCLRRAAQAAALCVTRPGAMDSVPAAHEVEEWRERADLLK